MRIPTGFRGLDEALAGGLGRGELTVLAARPSHGKTTLALNIAANMAARIPPLAAAIFSMEQDREALLARMLASAAGVNCQGLRRKHRRKECWPKLREASARLSAGPLYVDDRPGIAAPEIRTRTMELAAELRANGGPELGLIVVDSPACLASEAARRGQVLGLCRALRNAGREERPAEPRRPHPPLDGILRELKRLAREADVPVLALSSLSRSLASPAPRPGPPPRPRPEPSPAPAPRPRPAPGDRPGIRVSAAVDRHADAVIILDRQDWREALHEPASQADVPPARGNRRLLVCRIPSGQPSAAALDFNRDTLTFSDAAQYPLTDFALG